MTSRSADAVIVGAGAVGASCAFHLARAGLRVVVLEARSSAGLESSGKSAGGIRCQFSASHNVEMSLRSLALLSELELLEEIGYRATGYLLLVPEEGWSQHLDAVTRQRACGGRVEVLDVAAAQERVAFRGDGLAGATLGIDDGIVDPHWLTQAFVRRAREAGAEFRFERAVGAFRSSGDRWLLSTAVEEVTTPIVVNATGAWAGRVASLAGLDLAVEPLRSMIFLTDERATSRDLPLTVDLATGFWLRSEGRKLLFGLTDDAAACGFTRGMDWDWLPHVLEAGLDRFPWLAELGVDRRGSWWGYYEMTPDHCPVIGWHPGTKGWVDVAGFSGHGLQQSPYAGRLVAELVLGVEPSLDLSPFRHDRFDSEHGETETWVF